VSNEKLSLMMAARGTFSVKFHRLAQRRDERARSILITDRLLNLLRKRFGAWKFNVRRSLRIGLFSLGLGCAFAGSPLWATEYTVNSAADDGTAGTLRWAIEQANANPGSNDTITFDSGLSSISLSSGLPVIDKQGGTLSIEGSGASSLTIDGGSSSRAFFVHQGTVTIKDVTIANGTAQGGNGGAGHTGGGGGLGAGGAIFVDQTANVTLENVNIVDSAAQGGNGGNAGVGGYGGGGGGGLGGDGGGSMIDSNGGAGGGGFQGNGGDGGNGGGGGGGIYGSGGNGNQEGGGGGGGSLSEGGMGDQGGGGGAGLNDGEDASGILGGASGAGGGTGATVSIGATDGGAGGGGGSPEDPGTSATGTIGGTGGKYGGGGGGAGNAGSGAGGTGGTFGGGGGNSGTGGDFGGGGGGTAFIVSQGGVGGFGGGGGGAGAQGGGAGARGFGAGNGGNGWGFVGGGDGGGGGDGLGGAIFVREGGTLTLINTGVSGSQVDAGSGGLGYNLGSTGANGTTAGSGFYFMSGTDINLQVNDPDSQTYDDDIFTDASVNKTGDGTLTINGDISGDGSVSNSDGGTLNLNGNNTYTGGTTLNDGIVAITSADNLGTGDVTFNGGILDITNDVTLDNGVILNADGTIRGQDQATSDITLNGNISGTGALTLQEGQFHLEDATNDYTGGTVIKHATVYIDDDGQLGDAAGDLTLNGGALVIQGPLTSDRDVLLETFGGFIGSTSDVTWDGDISGTGEFAKSGSGVLTLNGTNTYTGDTKVIGGTLQLGSTGSLASTTNLNIASGATFDLNDNTQTIGALSGSGKVKLGSGALTTDTDDDSSFSGVISGTGSFTKDGTGTLTLSGNNTYTGGTSINGGVLAINNNSNLGDASGILTFDGGTLRTDAGIGTVRKVTLGTDGGTIDTNGFDSTFSGVISGTGSLTKDGTGMLTLNKANTYTGDTNVMDGTLKLGTNGSLADTTNLFIDTDGTFDVNYKTQTIGALSGDGNLLLGFGTLTTNTSTESTFSGEISGIGTLSLQGGTKLALDGSGANFLGVLDVQDGHLTVDGNFGSSVAYVSNASQFSGIGTIGGVFNSGLFTPGGADAIGTMTVNNIFTQLPDGTLGININADAATPVAGVNNDLVDVNGSAGVAVLSGKVDVVAQSGNYYNGMRFDFLTVDNGPLVGAFDPTVADNLAFFDAVLGYDYDNGTAYFTLNSIQSDFSAFATNYNQTQIGNYLDFHSLNPTPDLQDLITQLHGMTTDDLQMAMSQMTGEVYGTAAQLQIQNVLMMQLILRQNILGGNQNVNGFAANARPASQGQGRRSGADVSLVKNTKTGEPIFLINCLDDTPGDQSRGWISGYGLGGFADSDGNAGSARYNIGGTLFGLDRKLDSVHTVGMFGSYSYLDLKAPTRNQSVISNGGQFGGYGIRDLDWTYTMLSGAFGFTEYDSTRRITAGGLNATAEATYQGWQANTWLEQGLRFRRGNFVLQPFTALNYIYVDQNSFNETGAGVMNLSVDRIDAHALRGVLGTSLSTSFTTQRGGTWTPTARAMWLHEFLDPETSLNTTFASVGGPSFATQGLNFGRDWAVVGAGLSWQATSQLSIFTNYDIQMNDYQVFNVGSGGLQYVW